MNRRVAVAVGLAISVLSWTGCSSDTVSGAGRHTAPDTAQETVLGPTSEAAPDTLTIRVVDVIDHDTDSFTQGLVFSSDDRLFESTGEYGDSEIREIDPRTGRVLRSESLPDDVFAEGLALGSDGLVQLTWKEGRAFRWVLDDLRPMPGWNYDGEGWGLTYDASDDTFLRSDGTAAVTRHRGSDFAVVESVRVTRDGRDVSQLNELELIDGELFANVWQTDDIVRIDLETGRVTGIVDVSSLRQRGALADATLGPDDVLNGIAHRPGDPPNRWYVTGKNWPSMFVVDVEVR